MVWNESWAQTAVRMSRVSTMCDVIRGVWDAGAFDLDITMLLDKGFPTPPMYVGTRKNRQSIGSIGLSNDTTGTDFLRNDFQ